jgi:hypothetical protein
MSALGQQELLGENDQQVVWRGNQGKEEKGEGEMEVVVKGEKGEGEMEVVVGEE